MRGDASGWFHLPVISHLQTLSCQLKHHGETLVSCSQFVPSCRDPQFPSSHTQWCHMVAWNWSIYTLEISKQYKLGAFLQLFVWLPDPQDPHTGGLIYPVLESFGVIVLQQGSDYYAIKGQWWFLRGGRWLRSELLKLPGWPADSLNMGGGLKDVPFITIKSYVCFVWFSISVLFYNKKISLE